MLAPEQRLILVNDKGDDEQFRRALARVGLEPIEGFVQGGMAAWANAGMDFTRTAPLSTREVAERNPDTQILDVRRDKEWIGGHMEDAIHIPLGELEDRVGELQKSSDITAFCGSGYRSSIAASLLQGSGFGKISSMDSGVTACSERRLPLITS